MVAQAKDGQIESNPTAQTNLRRITAIEAILPQLATKADVERQTRLLILWHVGAQIALFAALFAVLSRFLG